MYHPLMRHTPTFSCCFFQLDLKLNSDKGGDTSTYVTNGEWDLIGENKRKSASGCHHLFSIICYFPEQLCTLCDHGPLALLALNKCVKRP